MKYSGKNAGGQSSAFVFIIAWLVLLLLTGISLLSSYLHLGTFAPVVEFGIAATQAAIIFVLFMRLKGPPSLNWLFAGAGFFWLLLLYGISMTDYATRRGWPLH
ncbi:MAG TPA: cytochrome C oxidase subunit IV family protein [Stellaceae bacterium]|jgi:cytochrome c oxidase subunit 4